MGNYCGTRKIWSRSLLRLWLIFIWKSQTNVPHSSFRWNAPLPISRIPLGCGVKIRSEGRCLARLYLYLEECSGVTKPLCHRDPDWKVQLNRSKKTLTAHHLGVPVTYTYTHYYITCWVFMRECWPPLNVLIAQFLFPGDWLMYHQLTIGRQHWFEWCRLGLGSHRWMRSYRLTSIQIHSQLWRILTLPLHITCAAANRYYSLPLWCDLW